MSNIKNPKVELAGRDKILRRLAKHLKPLGFKRSKTTLFTRSGGEHIVEVVTVSKWPHWPRFWVSVTIQVRNDPFTFLNGFHADEDEYEYPRGNVDALRKYNFRYHIAEETRNRCVQNLYEFVEEIVDPWFQQWRDMNALLSSPDSPLAFESHEALERALRGDIDQSAVEKTLNRLGL